MLLRSSSTPILGSLLASSSCSSPHFAESPGHGGGNPLERTHSDNLLKLSFHHGGAAHLSAASSPAFSCQFSPSPAASAPGPAAGGFRRVRSDGNLQDLAGGDRQDEHLRRSAPHFPPPPRAAGSRRPASVLESIPSFSFYNHRGRRDAEDAVPEETEEEEEDEQEEGGDGKDGIERSVTIGDSIGAEFIFPGGKANAAWNAGEESGAAPLFLAKGLGLGAGDGASGLIVGFGADAAGGGGGAQPGVLGGGGQSDMEQYYKKMVEEDPHNALFLRNYAQFLYQTKADPRGAEQYYSRAILEEPGDGEVLSQYARLIWDLHGDRERASSYFERSVQAAPQDSHVLAAYAGFLWETEDDEDGGDGNAGRSQDFGMAPVSCGALASAQAR